MSMKDILPELYSDYPDLHKAVYEYLVEKFGIPKIGWKFIRQSLIPTEDKYFDKFLIEVRKGKEIEIYFYITDFFGK